MKNINLAQIPSLLIAFSGFIVASVYDKDIGIKIILIGFSLFIIIMLGFAWFASSEVFGGKSIWGTRISLTGFAIIGFPMVLAFWQGLEPSKLSWNIGFTIFIIGMFVSFLEQRNGQK